MRNVIVTHRPTVQINMTANDWELYGKDNRDAVASQMNRKIEHIINNAEGREQAWPLIAKVLREYSDFGASDSEGIWHAEEILSAAFN